MTDDHELAELASEIESMAERLADRALDLLRSAVADPADPTAAATEKVVTRARRALERAAALLRAAGESS